VPRSARRLRDAGTLDLTPAGVGAEGRRTGTLGVIRPSRGGEASGLNAV
jgi:hypothetical protein